MDCQLIITSEAKKYFQNILKTKDKAIKVELKSAGCSGYMYNNSIISINDENLMDNKNIEIIYCNEVPFVIDKNQKDLINNTLVTLKQDGLNNKIIYEHPEAYHACGCGESFAIKKELV